ncbi:MAG TPA: ECF transporter S component, partial [Ruminococcaceae bacterium]|nr:ECF transporter S component [Oscillospiraceae bacterium]
MENAKNAANRASRFDIRAVAQVGILGGMAFLLMMVEIPLWFAPGFYKLDLSEIPVLIGGFAIGPLAGVMIELVKVVLYFFIHGSSTAGVGDFANFVIGCCMVVPAALIYKRRKTRRTAMLGLAA